MNDETIQKNGKLCPYCGRIEKDENYSENYDAKPRNLCWRKWHSSTNHASYTVYSLSKSDCLKIKWNVESSFEANRLELQEMLKKTERMINKNE